MATTIMQAPSGVTGQVTTEWGNATISAAGLVTVDSRAVDALEGAGFKIVDANFVSGSHTATADEATANEAVIETGLGTITSFVIQILRADVTATGDAVLTAADGDLTIADGASTYAVTAGDVINYFAFGY